MARPFGPGDLTLPIGPAAVQDAGMDSEALADCELTALDGTKVRAGTLWAERPVVLVFLRHFG